MIKTFRSRLESGAQQRIRLQTIAGKVGYRIKKFQLLGVSENQTTEGSCKIFSVQPTAVTTSVNFSDATMLAAALYGDSSATPGNASSIVIFDSTVFSQDIFITWNDGFAQRMNYYLELEQISLDDVEATAVILKNFRNTNTVT